MCIAQVIEQKHKVIIKIAAQQETLETITERLARIIEIDLLIRKHSMTEIKNLIKVGQQFVQSLSEQTAW